MVKTTIVSPVGNRPIAVINPILHLLEDQKIDDCKILLCYYQKIIPACEQSKAWLLDKFPNLQIEMVTNDQALQYCLDHMNREKLYFNINPGLNFALSQFALQFPENIDLFSSDTEFLYVWQYQQNIENARKVSLKSIGIDNYLKLSCEKIQTAEGIKDTLCQEIQQCLEEIGANSSFAISLRVPESIAAKVSKRIVWIKEHKGSLYILIDLVGKKLVSDYRIVRAVFPKVFFNISLVIDDATGKLAERLELDGTHYINIQEDGWRDKVKNWVNGEELPKPKQISPEKQEQVCLAKTQDAPQEFRLLAFLQNLMKKCCFWSKKDSVVFSCLGDNLEPTLKVILSHENSKHVVFYDDNSPQIKHLATCIQSRFSHKDIIWVGSDYLGKNIVPYVQKTAPKYNSYCNITPGTKQQTIALSRAARLAKISNKVYSIENRSNSILSVLSNDKLCDCKSPSVEDIVYSQLAPGRTQKRKIENEELWALILQGLAEGTIHLDRERGDKHRKLLFTLVDNNQQPIFEDLGENRVRCLGELEYCLDNETIEKSGTWWEAVVAYAFQKHIDPNTLWQIEWGWYHSPKEKFTELDVVSIFKEQNCIVVSCKARDPENFSLKEESFIIDSEAKQRFGRFAMSFIAVPYEITLEESDIKILTPSILNSQEKLLRFLEKCLTEKKTT